LRRAGDLELGHDALARLASVRRGGSLVARYRYDALGAQDPESFAGRGRRIAKDVVAPAREQPAGFIRFLYAGDSVIEERSADAQMLRQLLREDDGRPAILVVQDPGVPPVSYELLHDAVGSVTAAVSPAGQVVESYRYGLHGQPSLLNSFGSPIRFSELGLTALFAGLEHDFESGLHSVGARHLDPAFGRFVSDANGLLPAGLLHLNGYLLPGVPGLPGEIPGASSPIRRAAYLDPFRVELRGIAPPPAVPGGPQP
jgi:hypothetical protein